MLPYKHTQKHKRAGFIENARIGRLSPLISYKG